MALVGAVSVCSCDKPDNGGDDGPEGGKIWDIAPVVYRLKVVNALGNDILDPSKDISIDYKAIEAVYNGEAYKIKTEPQTRDYLPHFNGLELIYYTHLGHYTLTFGELEGAESYDNEELRINWGDGTSDVVSFDRDFKWGKKGDPEVSHKWFLNGKAVEPEYGGVIKIVK